MKKVMGKSVVLLACAMSVAALANTTPPSGTTTTRPGPLQPPLPIPLVSKITSVSKTVLTLGNTKSVTLTVQGVNQADACRMVVTTYGGAVQQHVFVISPGGTKFPVIDPWGPVPSTLWGFEVKGVSAGGMKGCDGYASVDLESKSPPPPPDVNP